MESISSYDILGVLPDTIVVFTAILVIVLDALRGKPGSAMLPVIAESCPTKLFLSNPGMDRETYRRAFQLNETEAERIANLVPKQEILIKQPDLAKVGLAQLPDVVGHGRTKTASRASHDGGMPAVDAVGAILVPHSLGVGRSQAARLDERRERRRGAIRGPDDALGVDDADGDEAWFLAHERVHRLEEARLFG